MPSSRSRPFVFQFHPNGAAEDDSPSSPAQWVKPKIITPNSLLPIPIENEHFKGQILLVHETGNEPFVNENEAGVEVVKRRGVQLQIQGKFKHASTSGPGRGLWVGGVLSGNLSLGWFTEKIVQAALKFAKNRTEGRIHCVLGNKTGGDRPHMAFPIAQVFTIVVTPPGEEPPVLGSEELQSRKWQGAATQINVDTENTYTMVYKTPYMDLCSWELLNVPAVSPLPLENILRDITASKVMLYDLGLAGDHANWRKGCLLEWYFSLGSIGDRWIEDVSDGAKTPLEEASEPSEASEVEEDDGEMIVDNVSEASDDSGSSAEPVAEDDEEMSRADSIALLAIDSWRPGVGSPLDAAACQAEMTSPCYIEAIDRRRRRRLTVWFVFKVVTNEQQQQDLEAPEAQGERREWWYAKSISELSRLCRPHKRVKMFRSSAHRKCMCAGVESLEEFRKTVCERLGSARSQLRTNLISISAAGVQAQASEGASTPETQGSKQKRVESAASSAAAAADWPFVRDVSAATDDEATYRSGAPTTEETPHTGSVGTTLSLNSAKHEATDQSKLKNVVRSHLTAGKEKLVAGKERIVAGKEKISRSVNRRRKPLVPPRFLVTAGSSACEMAFANAKEGRGLGSVVMEGLVGSMQFEGRLVEELLRLSKDGILRCFVPYGSEKPRLRIPVGSILRVESTEDVFLGRFYRFEVHTLLRVYIFCCAVAAERDEWVTSIRQSLERADETGTSIRSDVAADLGDTMATSQSLLDNTGARRWRPSSSLILNDRSLISAGKEPAPLSVAGDLLAKLINRDQNPSRESLIDIMDASCQLKTVRFKGRGQEELVAFWMNVYHCLLLHGRLLLGVAKTHKELLRFNSRVSYIVGQRVVSLKDIERVILHIPCDDRQAAVVAYKTGRARIVQLFTALCPCRQRSAAASKANAADAPAANGGKVGDKHATKSKSPLGKKYLPKNLLAQVQPWRKNISRHSCLYLGLQPEAATAMVPSQDLRVLVCLNRGSLSSLATMPILRAEQLNKQLDEIAAKYFDYFVEVLEVDNNKTTVTLPYFCRLMMTELNMDQKAILRFVWQFFPDKQAPMGPGRKVNVRFQKDRPEPRHWTDIVRASSAATLGSSEGVEEAAYQPKIVAL